MTAEIIREKLDKNLRPWMKLPASREDLFPLLAGRQVRGLTIPLSLPSVSSEMIQTRTLVPRRAGLI